MEQLTLFDNRDTKRDIVSRKMVGSTELICQDLSNFKSPAPVKHKGKKLKVGENVHYHSIIGGPITSSNHRIYHIDYYKDIAFITNHGACVAIEALSRR